MKEQLYVAIHEHRHGTSVYLIKSDHEPTEEEVVKFTDMDFEADRDDESLTIELAGEIYTILEEMKQDLKKEFKP